MRFCNNFFLIILPIPCHITTGSDLDAAPISWPFMPASNATKNKKNIFQLISIIIFIRINQFINRNFSIIIVYLDREMSKLTNFDALN